MSLEKMKQKEVAMTYKHDEVSHMTLDKFLEIFRESEKDDWETFKRSSKHQYAYRAAYKHNLSIGLGWGLPLNEFDADWLKPLEIEGPHYNTFVTFFYNGMPVYQKKCVEIANSICYFPLPKEGKGFFSVDTVEFNFIKRFNEILGKIPFHDLFEKSGIEIRE